MAKFLVRYDWNKILSAKRLFIYIEKDKNGTEYLEKRKFEA